MSKKPPATPSKSCPAPTAAAKWAKSPASTPRKNSAPTTSSPSTKPTTSASSPNPEQRLRSSAVEAPAAAGYAASQQPVQAALAYNLSKMVPYGRSSADRLANDSNLSAGTPLKALDPKIA